MSNKLIKERSYDFSLDIIKLYMQLKNEKEYILSKQLLRSGTSIGANVQEASAAQSKRDFLSKMSIASKEARETRYWLNLLKDSKINDIDYKNHLKEIKIIIGMLTKIVKTTAQNLNK